MRMYSFTNFMLSSMAQGIQPLHAVAEMSIKYQNDEKHQQYYDWAKNHKTMICLSAGVYTDLKYVRDFFTTSENPYAWSEFCEDESLDFQMTSVAIVLPEKIYEASSLLRSRNFVFEGMYLHCLDTEKTDFETLTELADKNWTFTQWEQDLVKLVGSKPLAK